MLLSLHPGLR